MNEADIQQAFAKTRQNKLVISILVDVIGVATYLIPVLGEAFDFGWAPVAAMINYFLHGGGIGLLGGTFTLAEELLPGTDIIPSVTLTWFVKYVLQKEATFEKFKRKYDSSISKK